MNHPNHYRKFLLLLTILCLGCLLTTNVVNAGYAPGVLDCKSAGKTRPIITLSGEVPGDYETLKLKITKGKDEYSLRSLDTVDRDMDPEERKKLEDDGTIANDRVVSIVEDFSRGIFSMAVRGTERYNLRLYAIPATVRSRITPNSKKASFDALFIEGDVYPNWKKAMRLRCTFDHSV